MQGFAFTRSSSWLWFWLWLTAMKGTNSAEGDPPVCKKPLPAEYLQHCAERSKNPHQNRLSLPEKPALSRTGALMLWVSLSLILFLSCFCRQQQSWLVWWLLQTTHESFLSTWCKQMIQKPVPKYDPSPCAKPVQSFILCSQTQSSEPVS